MIHVLDPFKIYSSPTNFALVAIDPGSDPKSGSVIPKHPINYPFDNPGMYLSFNSLVPNSLIGWITKELWTLKADLYALSTLSIYLLIRPYAVDETPGRPYSESVQPKNPASPYFLKRRGSNV